MLVVLDCNYKGETCEWHERADSGDFEGYGKGSMKLRQCHKCRTIEYIYFTPKDPTQPHTDIEGMLKAAGLRQEPRLTKEGLKAPLHGQVFILDKT